MAISEVTTACIGCGQKMKFESTPKEPVTCGLCRQLGPRSIVRLLATPRNTPEFEEALAAFRASPPGSVLFERGIAERKARAAERQRVAARTAAAVIAGDFTIVFKEGEN